MPSVTDRTKNFKKKISIERQALSAANKLSQQLKTRPLLGLSHAAIDSWLSNLYEILPSDEAKTIEAELKELAIATGLLADQSRCAVAEGKVSSDIPSLYERFSQKVHSTLMRHS